ncbi:hypothetical protein AGMMS49579_22390 [Spirochaetia bacterium]|nr:hypothetical protein AGMMS49579_22390 [Spirochaetia bacterium]
MENKMYIVVIILSMFLFLQCSKNNINAQENGTGDVPILIESESDNIYVYNLKTKEKKQILINERNIISANIIKVEYLNKYIIEIIGSTNMGNGNIYLYDTNLNLLLKEYYYNIYMESWEYYVFHENELFKNREYIQGETISEIFRNNSLNIEYNFNNKGIIHIYGIRDYISELNDKEEVIYSEDIDLYYEYSNKNNKYYLLEEKN